MSVVSALTKLTCFRRINMQAFALFDKKRRQVFGSVQGIFTKGYGSVQLTSLYQLDQIRCFHFFKCLYFLQARCLNKEVKCTEPYPFVRLPWSVNGEWEIINHKQIDRWQYLSWLKPLGKKILLLLKR